MMGLVFVLGSAGYSLGTMIGGRILDRGASGHIVLGVAQLCTGLLTFCIPLSPWFWLLLVVAGCKGFAEGFINTGANALLIWTHGEKVGPFMNGLHFFFGLGAVGAPLLMARLSGIAIGYVWAYWTIAVLMLAASIRMFTLPVSPRRPFPHEDGATVDKPSPQYLPAMITAALFLFFYVGGEITLGGWMYSYAVMLHLANAVGAAYLNSGFWFSFTLGRLISIPIATRVKPKQVLPIALSCCLLLLGFGILFPDSSPIFRVMVFGLGFCMAPIWPTGFTMASQSIDMTGRASGIVLLGDSFGGMVLPWLAGRVIGSIGPAAILPLITSSLALCFLAAIILQRYEKGRVARGWSESV
jgi:FHS family Na+ dependent glucose MFS transporter 1